MLTLLNYKNENKKDIKQMLKFFKKYDTLCSISCTTSFLHCLHQVITIFCLFFKTRTHADISQFLTGSSSFICRKLCILMNLRVAK